MHLQHTKSILNLRKMDDVLPDHACEHNELEEMHLRYRGMVFLEFSVFGYDKHFLPSIHNVRDFSTRPSLREIYINFLTFF